MLAVVLAGCGSSGVGPPAGSFDCSANAAGTGDLAVDIVGQWFWVQNASAQYFTFASDGMAVRTWTSDVSDEVTYTSHDYVVESDVVRIGGYGDFRFTFDDGSWTVDDPAAITDWIRCREI